MHHQFFPDPCVAIVTSDPCAAATLHERLRFQTQRVSVFQYLDAMWQCLDVRNLDLLLLDLRDLTNVAALKHARMHLPSGTLLAAFGDVHPVLPDRVVFRNLPDQYELSALLQLALRERWPDHALVADLLH